MQNNIPPELKEVFEAELDVFNWKDVYDRPERETVLTMLSEAYTLGQQGRWISVETPIDAGTKVIAAMLHWNTKNYRYAELIKVNESDCDWRTVDDNSELSYDWTVTHYQIPTPPKI